MEQREQEDRREEAVLSAIDQVFREEVHCQTEEDLAKTCLAVAVELTGSRFGFLGELNPAGRFDAFVLSASGGEGCTALAVDAGQRVSDMEVRGIWGRVLQEGGLQIAHDPLDTPDWVGFYQGRPRLTAFLGVPLKQAGKTFGMIGLADKEGGYDTAAQEAMASLSVAIAEALWNKRARERLARQAQEPLGLSAPVIQVWEGMVVVPLSGTLSNGRVQGVLERLRDTVVGLDSPMVLLDITEVSGIDLQAARHLVEIVRAIQRSGVEVVVTGMRAIIALTLVHQGMDLFEVEKRPSLAAGLLMAMRHWIFQRTDRA